jgi:hypothetical protein
MRKYETSCVVIGGHVIGGCGVVMLTSQRRLDICSSRPVFERSAIIEAHDNEK